MRKIIWYLFILSILFYTINLDIGLGINFNLSDLLIGLAFVLVIIDNVLVRNTFLPIFNNMYWYIWIIIMFLSFGSLVSAMFSDNVVGSTTNLIQYIFIFIILLTVLEYLVDTKIENAIKLSLLTILPGVLTSVLVLISFLNLYNGLDSTIISYNGRYTGFDGIATEFGNKMTLYTITALFGVFYFRQKKIKIMYLVLTILFTFTSLLSGSFGTLLILYIIFLLYLFFGFKLKFIPRAVGVFSIVYVLYQYYQITVEHNYKVLTYLPTIMQERFGQFNNFGSIETRFNINSIAIEDFFNNPLIGVGYGQYRFYNDLNISVHNTFLSAAVEMGIIGVLGVLIYTLLPVIISMKMYLKIKGKMKVFIIYLMVYSLVRLLNTIKAQEYIDREPWIPILILLILFAKRKNIFKMNKEGFS